MLFFKYNSIFDKLKPLDLYKPTFFRKSSAFIKYKSNHYSRITAYHFFTIPPPGITPAR